jgi:hypothetical protein
MEPHAGALSPDSWWTWDGGRWVPAISSDGLWRWNGSGWVAVPVRRRPSWQPAWERHDTVTVSLWLLAVPAALALVTLGVGRLGRLTAVGWLAATIAAYAAWAFIGGAVVRPQGRWPEVLLIAGALVAFVALVDIAAFTVVAAVGRDQAGDDDGVAVGLVMLFVFVFPPTVLPVAIGRLLRRAVMRSRPGT